MELSNKRQKIRDGMYLNLVKTNKFKTNLINMYIIRPLDRKEVTKNALIPLVLRRGTSNFKTTIDINRKLEDLYGSILSISVTKKGEKQVIRFTIEGPNRSFINQNDLFKEQLNLIYEIIANPLLKNNTFVDDYIKQEKNTLRKRIEGRINNKKQYAIDRCIEEMCKEEKFSIFKYGYIEDIDNISSKELYNHYLDILKTSPIEISVVGDVEMEYLRECVDTIFNLERKEIVNIQREDVFKHVNNEKEVFEDMNVSQGKLTLGYRTNIPYESELYEAFLLASDILGGGPYSKLFTNVREKESLAYYIHTKSYKLKSIMIITSGIETKKYEKAVEIIKKQVEEMKKGNFSEGEIEQSKKSIITSIKTLFDSNFSLSEFHLSKSLLNDRRDINDIIEKIKNTDKEEIIKSIEKASLDTIYFLRKKDTDKEEKS